MEDVVLGFDPGGAGRFGWCALILCSGRPQVLAYGNAPCAEHAVRTAIGAGGTRHVLAAGIDAPLYWSTVGHREVDNIVRRAVIARGGKSGTVSQINSLRGACVAQGLMTAHLLRQRDPAIVITEAHPKAALLLLGLSPSAAAAATLRTLATKPNPLWQLPAELNDGDEHCRDAAVAALGASHAIASVSDWENVAAICTTDYVPLEPHPQFWLPKFAR